MPPFMSREEFLVESFRQTVTFGEILYTKEGYGEGTKSLSPLSFQERVAFDTYTFYVYWIKSGEYPDFSRIPFLKPQMSWRPKTKQEQE